MVSEKIYKKNNHRQKQFNITSKVCLKSGLRKMRLKKKTNCPVFAC